MNLSVEKLSEWVVRLFPVLETGKSQEARVQPKLECKDAFFPAFLSPSILAVTPFAWLSVASRYAEEIPFFLEGSSEKSTELAKKETAPENFSEEEDKLHQLESELLISATESPEKASEQLAVVEALAQKYSQLSQHSADEKFQESYLQLAVQTYDILAKVADGSPFEAIRARRELYTGYRMLSMGDFEGAKAALKESKDCPEAKVILEKMDRDSQRMKNLGALDVWSTYVGEKEALDMDAAQGWANISFGTLQYFVEGDHKTKLDRVAEKWNLDRDLIHEVKTRLRSDQAATIDEALRQIIADADARREKGLLELKARHERGEDGAVMEWMRASSEGIELKSRAQGLLAQEAITTENGGYWVAHLIRYATNQEPDADRTQDLLRDADQIGLRESAVQSSYGLYSYLKTTNPRVKEECEKHLTEMEQGKSLPGKVWDMIRTTGTDDLAQIAIMHGATKLGSLAKLATLVKLEKVGVTGYKALGIAYSAEVLAEGTTMWALNTGYEALSHDSDKVFDSHRLLNSWGANLIMVGGLKATGALSRKYAPQIAKAFGQMPEGQLTMTGQGIVVGMSHLAGVGGMVGTGRLNQALGLSERPKGGFQESLVNDVFNYIKYGIAEKGVDQALGPEYVAARVARQKKIESREAKLLEAAKRKPETFDPPMTLGSARRALNWMESPLLAPFWTMMGVDGLGGGLGKGGPRKEEPSLENLEKSLSDLQSKNPEDPAIAEHYLVIADLLQSQGDPRGELIALGLKHQELQASHADPKAIGRLKGAITRIRGRVEGDIRARFGLVVEYRFDPVKGFQLLYMREDKPMTARKTFGLFLQSEYSSLLTRIEVERLKQVDWLFSKSTLSQLTGLRELSVSWNWIGIEEARALAESPSLGNLQSLDLWNNVIGNEGARALAQSSALVNLKSLNLGRNRIGEEGARALAQSSTFFNLRSLILEDNHFGHQGARAIAVAPTLVNLQSLDLGHNHIGDEGIRALATSPTLFNLQTLDLGGNDIDDEGARAISKSPTFMNLQTFDLGQNNIGNEGVRAMAESPILKNLQFLRLGHNQIGYEGARVLAGSLTFSKLLSLDLGGNNIGYEGARAFAESLILVNLKSLGLVATYIGKEGERIIRESPYLSNLKILNGKAIHRPPPA